MNRRSEASLKVYSRAVVILIDDPEREYTCSLTDISSAGFKLLSSESLPAAATAAIEVENHLILARIRHSEERGSEFAIGIQRLHTLAKWGFTEDATKLEKIQALINDFQRQGTLEREFQDLFDEEQGVREPELVALAAVKPNIPDIPVIPGSRPPAAVPALPKLAAPSPARFAAVHPVVLHQAITPQPQAMTPAQDDIPVEVEVAPIRVDAPDDLDAVLFEWAEKSREQDTRRLLKQHRKLVRSRQMMLVIVAGVAIITLEAILLIVLVPRGHLHRSYRAPVVDSTSLAARLAR
jgi:hypothetical protein